MSLILGHGKQRISELEASLIHMASSRMACTMQTTEKMNKPPLILK